MTNVSDKLRVAVVGTGRISDEHLRFLRSNPIARTVAVCDLSPALADFAAKRYGVPQTYTDCRQMLKREKPDVLHVLTPPHTHGRLVTDGLAHDAHVIVEKPIACTRAEFHELWSVAKRHRRYLVEDHNYRFNKPILAMDQLVSEGKLGEVRDIEVRMVLPIRQANNRYADGNLPHPSHAMPAGVIHEFLTHLCYLALRFLPTASANGEEFQRVRAAWNNHGGGDLFKYDSLDAVVITGPVHVRLRFDCHARPDCLKVTVHGTKGSAHTDLFQPHLQLAIPRSGPKQLTPVINQYLAGRDLSRAAVRNLIKKIMQETPYEGIHTFLKLTYNAIHKRSEPPVSYEDMDGTMQLMDALLDEANRL